MTREEPPPHLLSSRLACGTLGVHVCTSSPTCETNNEGKRRTPPSMRENHLEHLMSCRPGRFKIPTETVESMSVPSNRVPPDVGLAPRSLGGRSLSTRMRPGPPPPHQPGPLPPRAFQKEPSMGGWGGPSKGQWGPTSGTLCP